MENPYQAPESDIDKGEIQKRSVFWKIYFFIITILSFSGMATFLLSSGAGIVDYAQLVLLIIATAGLYGFVFCKRVLTPGFWIPFLIFYIFAGIIYEPLSSVNMRQGMSDSMYYISFGIGFVISLPGYYALYRYGKKHEQPWINIEH
jgi:hypothetical protein